MRFTRPSARSGFTLVEVLIGMSLALVMLTAVLSSYIYLGRSLNRVANQNILETQARRTLAQFAEDVRMAGAASSSSDASTPTNVPANNPCTGIKLWYIPTASGTTNVTYTYDSTAKTLTRADSASGSSQIVLMYVQSVNFNCYSAYDSPAPNATTYRQTTAILNVLSIKQVDLRFTTRLGDQASGTSGFFTPTYVGVSPRLAMRNKSLPP